MRATLTARAGLLSAAMALILVTAACSEAAPGPTATSTSFPGAAVPAGSWPYPNGNLANTRDATARQSRPRTYPHCAKHGRSG
jgi:hypothetical protein